MQHRDVLWKGVLQWVLDDLLKFVFPNADEVFDFGKKFVYLDKELAALEPAQGTKTDTRFVDKLVKVFRKDEGEEWVLVHVEVQDKTKPEDRPHFPERMFRYYYRCFDRHRKPVVAIAIFCGPDGKLLAGSYKYEFMNTRLQYDFNTLCILDYSDEELASSKNPFAWVVLTAKKALLKGKDVDRKLLDGKLVVFRKLYENGVFEKSKLQGILKFLDHYIVFEKRETIRTFEQQVDKITRKKHTMDILNEIYVEKKSKTVVRNLLTKTSFSIEEIAALAEVPIDFVKRVKRNLRKRKK
jgi:DNA-dependent RNA polymerase auxiliary subunit epsilon